MKDWLELKADYFEPICKSVFDAYLKRHLFGPGRADEAGCLSYRRGRCVLKLHYYVEESPNYAPMVTIGLVPRFALRPQLGTIGLWYAVPAGVEAHAYASWRFCSAEELRVAMTRIRNAVVEVYGRPLWENHKDLAALIDKRMAEVKSERNAEIVLRKKSEAEAAFLSRDYRKAAALYGRMRESDLSALERKRYAYSKKRLA